MGAKVGGAKRSVKARVTKVNRSIGGRKAAMKRKRVTRKVKRTAVAVGAAGAAAAAAAGATAAVRRSPKARSVISRVVEQVRDTASNVGESVSGMMPGRSVDTSAYGGGSSRGMGGGSSRGMGGGSTSGSRTGGSMDTDLDTDDEF